MVSLAERLIIPLVGAGAVWVMGRAEGHGKGFQTYVRYAAVFMLGTLSIFAWHDKIEMLYAGPIRVLVILWSVIIVGVIWYHIR